MIVVWNSVEAVGNRKIWIGSYLRYKINKINERLDKGEWGIKDDYHIVILNEVWILSVGWKHKHKDASDRSWTNWPMWQCDTRARPKLPPTRNGHSWRKLLTSSGPSLLSCLWVMWGGGRGTETSWLRPFVALLGWSSDMMNTPHSCPVVCRSWVGGPLCGAGGLSDSLPLLKPLWCPAP